MGYVAIVGYQVWYRNNVKEEFRFCLSEVETTGTVPTIDLAASEAQKILQQRKNQTEEKRLVSLQIMKV